MLFLNLGDKEAVESLKAIESLRKIGVSAEMYPDAVKMKKQMSYANEKNIPFVGIIGDSELQAGKITLKNMVKGTQKLINKQQLLKLFEK